MQLQTLDTYAQNALEGHRRMRLTNDAFQRRVGSHIGGIDAMRAIGFASDAGFLVLTEDAWPVLQEAKVPHTDSTP